MPIKKNLTYVVFLYALACASIRAGAQDTPIRPSDSIARAKLVSEIKASITRCLTFTWQEIKKLETDLYIITLHCKDSSITKIEITSKETAVFKTQLQSRLDSALKGFKLTVPTAPRINVAVVLTFPLNSPGWLNGEMAMYWFGLFNSTDKFDFRFWYLSPIYQVLGMEGFSRENWMREDSKGWILDYKKF